MQCEAEILKEIIIEYVFGNGRGAHKSCCEHHQIVIIFKRNEAFLMDALQ